MKISHSVKKSDVSQILGITKYNLGRVWRWVNFDFVDNVELHSSAAALKIIKLPWKAV